jgi:hypothetical protein
MRALVKPLIATFVVGAIFLAYLMYIGIPKTQARNLYNEGLLQIQQGNISDGLELYRQAYTTWPEEYIKQELAAWENL